MTRRLATFPTSGIGATFPFTIALSKVRLSTRSRPPVQVLSVRFSPLGFPRSRSCSRAPTSLCHPIPGRASCTERPSPPASRETPFRPWGCLILTRRRGPSCSMPVGRWTANAVAHPMRDMCPSRGSCFARSSMTPRLLTGHPAAASLCIERVLGRRDLLRSADAPDPTLTSGEVMNAV